MGQTRDKPGGWGWTFRVLDPDADLSSLRLQPELLDFLETWKALRQGRQAPARPADLPGAFRRHLGWIALIERAGDDYRFRLVGSHVVDMAGRDATGKCMRQLYAPQDAAAIIAECAQVFDGCACLYSDFMARAPGRDFIRIAGLALPLAADGRTVDILISRYVIVD